MELAILKHFHEVKRDAGFPRPEDVRVTARTATPCGRYVSLCGSGLIASFVQLNMESVPNGMSADLRLTEPCSGVLELVVNGGDVWSGEEHGFVLVW